MNDITNIEDVILIKQRDFIRKNNNPGNYLIMDLTSYINLKENLNIGFDSELPRYKGLVIAVLQSEDLMDSYHIEIV